jgi:hypothetical protein
MALDGEGWVGEDCEILDLSGIGKIDQHAHTLASSRCKYGAQKTCEIKRREAAVAVPVNKCGRWV